jgi:hypothetical protein
MSQAQVRKYAYLLADKHVSEMPTAVIISQSPKHYGDKLTDDHRLFMWNALVDHYLALDEYTLYKTYKRHVEDKEPIVKSGQYEPLSPELEQLVDSIVQVLWSSQGK